MRIYIGGAHNGKREFVRDELKDQEGWTWIGADQIGMMDSLQEKRLVIEGLADWLAATPLSENDAIVHILKATERKETVFILTDIGRGIVPMDTAQRELRDRCGRMYQRLMKEAEEVTRIWYGLSQTILKRGEGR